jgi:transposase-like protein
VKDDKNERRYPLLPCPVCKTAMIGEKSAPNLPGYDRFVCLHCGAVVLREDSKPDDSTA